MAKRKSRGLFVVFKGKTRLASKASGRAAPYVWTSAEIVKLVRANPRTCYKVGNIDTQSSVFVGACKVKSRKRKAR